MISTAKDGNRSHCVISNMLDLFGDKWTFLLIRDLMFFGKHEYKEFLGSPEAIATNILSNRLRRLSKAGVIDEIAHPSNKSRKFYFLTEPGKDLLPILLEMIKWGDKHLIGLTGMEQLFESVRSDSRGFKRKVLHDLLAWEQEHLHERTSRKIGGQ